MCRHPLVKKPCRSLFCFPSLARLEEDLEQAYYRSLDVSVATFRCALDYTRRCNRVYSERHWDEDHGFPRFSMEGQPSGFRGCLQVVSSGKLHVLVRMVASGCMDQLTLSLGGQDGNDHRTKVSDMESFHKRVIRVADTLESLRVWFQDRNNVMPRGLVSQLRVSPEAPEPELRIQKRSWKPLHAC